MHGDQICGPYHHSAVWTQGGLAEQPRNHPTHSCFSGCLLWLQVQAADWSPVDQRSDRPEISFGIFFYLYIYIFFVTFWVTYKIYFGVFFLDIFCILLEKLPPFGQLFVAPAGGCSFRLQRWGPSVPIICFLAKIFVGNFYLCENIFLTEKNILTKKNLAENKFWRKKICWKKIWQLAGGSWQVLGGSW